MDTEDRINRQRVQHIIDSYRLDGDDGGLFADRLTQLLGTYPQPLIEIALTESIVKGWSEIPMPRGMRFIQRVHAQLRCWQPNLEPLAQLSSPLQTNACGTVSVDVEANVSTIQSATIEAKSTDTFLNPEQFEQITGLDPSLIFDEFGKVRRM